MPGLPPVLEEHRKRLDARPAPAGASAHGVGENPACGDRVELWLAETSSGLDAGYHGRGCSAVLAVASFASERLRGADRTRLAAFDLRAEVAALGGLARTQQHALELVVRALDTARAELARGYPLA
jgi:NifU-like protein involved in Fe-S cluster formation